MFLRMAAELLNRLNSDKTFARSFDRDPAGAAQELFPEFARIPKRRIQAALDTHLSNANRVFADARVPQAAAIGGLLSLVVRLTKTAKIRSAAKALAVAVITELANLFFVQAAEPIPE
jgi:hypothetical protein